MRSRLVDGDFYWYNDSNTDMCWAIEGTEAWEFKAYDCDTKLNAVCMQGQYATAIFPAQFTALLGEAQNAYEAELRCRSLGGHLPFFNSDQEYQEYMTAVGDIATENWLGIQRVEDSDRFVNVDGSEAYLPWASGEPNNANLGDENCVEAWRNGINDQNCYSGGRQYSCRIDKPPRCADIEPNCSSNCSSQFNIFFCPKTCGKCDTWTPEPIGDLSFLDNWNAENCRDSNNNCLKGENKNQCMVNPNNMFRNCHVSRKQCLVNFLTDIF